MMLHSERPKTGHGRRRGPTCGGYNYDANSSTRGVDGASAAGAAASAAATSMPMATEQQNYYQSSGGRPKTGHGRRQTMPEQHQMEFEFQQQQQQQQIPSGIGSSDADVLILDDPRPQTAATARRRRPQTGYGRRRPPMMSPVPGGETGVPGAGQGRLGLRSGSARQQQQQQQHHRNTIEDALMDLQQPMQEQQQSLNSTFPQSRPFSSKYKVLPDISGNGNGLQQQPTMQQSTLPMPPSQATSASPMVSDVASTAVAAAGGLRPEPGPESPRLLLALRMPNGSRMQRHFRPTSPLLDVRRFAEIAAEEDFSECEFVRADDRVAFRRRQLERSLEELDIRDRSLLILQEALDDDDEDDDDDGMLE